MEEEKQQQISQPTGAEKKKKIGRGIIITPVVTVIAAMVAAINALPRTVWREEVLVNPVLGQYESVVHLNFSEMLWILAAAFWAYICLLFMGQFFKQRELNEELMMELTRLKGGGEPGQ